MNAGRQILHEGHNAHARSQRAVIVCSIYDIHDRERTGSWCLLSVPLLVCNRKNRKRPILSRRSSHLQENMVLSMRAENDCSMPALAEHAFI